jgi:prepilin-type N-terminal cleavage/methylation domain-containing protein/prepilin-type processing-associated H-X9-DG protein
MRPTSKKRRALTLVELLVVMGVIAVLLAILLPAMSAGRHAALDLRCRAQLRSVTQGFVQFATDTSGTNRGDSDRLSDRLFRLEDFQESIYKVAEFWEGPPVSRIAFSPPFPALICPAAPGRLERRSGVPCSAGAVGPTRNVSVGFNRRLDTGTRYIAGRPFPERVYLGEKVMEFPDVPLVFDVDGVIAASRNVAPYYSAPPPSKEAIPDIYSTGKFWFPSFRHRGGMSVGFVGGHVQSSRQPTDEPWWRWDYQPNS